MKPMSVPVALAAVAPKVVGVNGKLPPPPQATPVFEMRPVAEKVAQPAAPPALETTKLVVEAVPVTARFVVVAAVPVACKNVKFWSVEEPFNSKLVWTPVVEKKLLVVAFVPVAFKKVKF